MDKKDLLRDSLREEYQALIDSEFLSNAEMRFIQGLRNYCVHREAPFTVAQLTWNKDGRHSAAILLDRNALLAWKNWDPPDARQYVEERTDDIDIEAIVRRRLQRKSDFHDWLAKRRRVEALTQVKIVGRKSDYF